MLPFFVFIPAKKESGRLQDLADAEQHQKIKDKSTSEEE
jgi:hypothetical protein